MNSKEKIYEILRTVISNENQEILPESEILSDIGISSFDFMQVIYDIETTFSVNISDEQLESLVKVQDLIDFVSEKE